MSPTIVIRKSNNRVRLVGGASGGPRIITSTVQVGGCVWVRPVDWQWGNGNALVICYPFTLESSSYLNYYALLMDTGYICCTAGTYIRSY